MSDFHSFWHHSPQSALYNRQLMLVEENDMRVYVVRHGAAGQRGDYPATTSGL